MPTITHYEKKWKKIRLSIVNVKQTIFGAFAHYFSDHPKPFLGGQSRFNHRFKVFFYINLLQKPFLGMAYYKSWQKLLTTVSCR